MASDVHFMLSFLSFLFYFFVLVQCVFAWYLFLQSMSHTFYLFFSFSRLYLSFFFCVRVFSFHHLKLFIFSKCFRLYFFRLLFYAFIVVCWLSFYFSFIFTWQCDSFLFFFNDMRIIGKTHCVRFLLLLSFQELFVLFVARTSFFYIFKRHSLFRLTGNGKFLLTKDILEILFSFFFLFVNISSTVCALA